MNDRVIYLITVRVMGIWCAVTLEAQSLYQR